MKISGLRLFLLLFGLALLAGCDTQPGAESMRAPESRSGPPHGERQGIGRLDRSHAGSAAPQALFKDPAGESVSIADFKGKPLLLNLWATWCAPCVVEMPTLDELAARDPRIEVLALSQDIDGKEKVGAFLTERKFKKLQPFLDPELSIMSELGISTLPATILYDASGREVWRMAGMEDWTGPRAGTLIDEALSDLAPVARKP